MLLSLPLKYYFSCLCKLSTDSVKWFLCVCTVIHKYKPLLKLLPMHT